jgi:hypothetical protein
MDFMYCDGEEDEDRVKIMEVMKKGEIKIKLVEIEQMVEVTEAHRNCIYLIGWTKSRTLFIDRLSPF